MRVGIDFHDIEDLEDTLERSATTAHVESMAALDRTVRAVHADAVVNALAIRDTGALAESVEFDREELSASRRVYTLDPAGLFQETGTSRHGPQPWLTPAAEQHVPELERELQRIGAVW